MRIVNKSNIPESLFRYLQSDFYDYDEKGDSFSVTELLNPVQIIVLKRRYAKVMTIDAIDRLWQLLGSGVHRILEEEPGIEKIERLKTTVLGRTISGRFDRIFNNSITDYKVTSVYTVMYGSRTQEWGLQLSMYRWLYFKQKGVLLGKIGFIVALLRDWSEKGLKPLKNGRENRYPKAPAMEIPLQLLSLNDTEDWVTEKVGLVLEAEKLPDKDLPKCTDEERWFRKDKMLYQRCAKYCDAAPFCSQLKKEKERDAIPMAEELI